jgi:hypothetical protein
MFNSSLPDLTRQSIPIKNISIFRMDARVKPAHDEKRDQGINA